MELLESAQYDILNIRVFINYCAEILCRMRRVKIRVLLFHRITQAYLPMCT